MLRTIFSHDARWVTNVRKRARQLLASFYHFKETHKSFLFTCAVLFMSVKIGLILLATFSTMAFLLGSATPYLAIEMSKGKAMLFVFPLTMITMLKLYFIGKILMTYDMSRSMMKVACRVLLLKGKQGIHRIKEAIPADVLPLSLEKAGNH